MSGQSAGGSSRDPASRSFEDRVAMGRGHGGSDVANMLTESPETVSVHGAQS